MKFGICYLWILIGFLFVELENIRAQQQYEYIDIHDLREKPIVQGTLNGKKAYFLLDTGSNITILNLSDSSEFGFRPANTPKLKVEGLIGQVVEIIAVFNVHLKLGTSQIRTSYLAYDMSAVVNNIHKNTKINITGIIGSDVMKQYGIVIDYEKEKVAVRKE